MPQYIVEWEGEFSKHKDKVYAVSENGAVTKIKAANYLWKIISVTEIVPPKVEPDFIAFIKNERAAFNKHFNGGTSHDRWLSLEVKDRVNIENLLIAYDQMVERLSKL